MALLCMYSSRQKNGDVSVSFRPVHAEVHVHVEWPLYAQKNGNRTERRPATGKRRKMQSTILIIASTKRHLESLRSQKKHRSVQVIAFGGEQSRLAPRGLTIIDS